MRKYSIIHLGLGKVGREVYQQIHLQRIYIQQRYHVDLTYCGAFTAKTGFFNPNGISEKQILHLPSQANSSIKNAIDHIYTPFILIDTTDSDETVPYLLQALKKDGFVVLSNKKPLAASQELYDKLLTLGKDRLFYETTVGAGLPIIQTLKTFIDTGDEVLEIQGYLSGTLGFICSSIENGTTFSQAVNEAKNLGYTEPDPRDDLAGIDVARKALILSRLMGKCCELIDIPTEALFTKQMAQVSIIQFMQKLHTRDAFYAKKFAIAQQNGSTIRYIAHITKSTITVGLKKIPKVSLMGSLVGPANCLVVKTKRYYDSPLIITGPGAGVSVTAAGVFGDILLAIQQPF